MLSEPWLTSIGYMQWICQILALAAIIGSPRKRQWKSLIASLSLDVATNFVLALTLGRREWYWLYFWAYWGSAFAQSVIRLWIMADVARSFPGLGFLPRKVPAFVGSAGVAMGFAVAWLTFRSGPTILARIHCFLLYSAAVNLGWMIFLTVVLACLRFTNASWDRLGFWVTWGIVAEVICRTLAEQLRAQSPTLRIWCDRIEPVCFIAVFASWAFAFRVASQRNTSTFPMHARGTN